jgi:D-arginine dehydrogenase
MAIDFDESFYFKPEVGQFLASPATRRPRRLATPSPRSSTSPIAVERLEASTTLQIGGSRTSGQGLRSFVADKNLVIGFDPAVDGFFWLAGQGGYGIQTGAAAGRLAASLALGNGLPDDIVALGVAEEALSPARFTQGVMRASRTLQAP